MTIGIRPRSRAIVPIVLMILAVGGSGCASGRFADVNLLPLTTGAQPGAVVPGSWTAVGALQEGSPIAVTTTTGTRLEGEFKSLAPPVLIVTTRAGATAVLLADVARIAGRSDGDTLANGILIGAGIGLGAAVSILAALGSQDGHVLPSAKVGAPLLLAGAGGLIGGLIDRARRHERILYLAESH